MEVAPVARIHWPVVIMIAGAVALVAVGIIVIIVLASRKSGDDEHEGGGTGWIAVVIIGAVIMLGCAGVMGLALFHLRSDFAGAPQVRVVAPPAPVEAIMQPEPVDETAPPIPDDTQPGTE